MTDDGRADHHRLGRAGARRAGEAGAARRDPVRGPALLVETGLAEHVLPELPALALERDEHHRHKDVYEHTLTVLEQSIDLEDRLPGGGPDFVVALRRADARRRQAAHAAVPADDGTVTFHHHDVVGRQADPQADAGAAVLRGRRPTRSPGWSSCTCGSTATARASGPTRPCAATSATPATSSTRLHVLTRADCTTRNQRKADRLRRTYDDLEDADRPALGGGGARLDPPRPRRQPDHGDPRHRGRAARSARPTGILLELRLDHGPLGYDRARQELIDWAAGPS